MNVRVCRSTAVEEELEQVEGWVKYVKLYVLNMHHTLHSYIYINMIKETTLLRGKKRTGNVA